MNCLLFASWIGQETSTNRLDLATNLRTQELRSAVGYAAFLISGDFLPINVSITDVLAGISAAVEAIHS